MTRQFVNIDAAWLQALADDLGEFYNAQKANEYLEHEGEEGAWLRPEIESRLRAIAANLESLDSQAQGRTSFAGSRQVGYDRGFADGVKAEADRQRARSNILSNPEDEDETGRSILAQINRRVAEGNVKRIALGERALDDKPHDFNAPVRKHAKPKPVERHRPDLGDMLMDI